jgi:hypothetical protein
MEIPLMICDVRGLERAVGLLRRAFHRVETLLARAMGIIGRRAC